MSTPLKLGAFAVAMLVVFGGAMAAGRAFSPSGPYKLVLAKDGFSSAGRHELSFRVEQDGEPVTSYETVHEKKLHFIAVRTEDLTGFQHLHPSLSDDGTWHTAADLEPGQWKVYADFTPTGREPQVLTATVNVAGLVVTIQPDGEPQESKDADADEYDVHLSGSLDGGMLTPQITTRDGQPVTPEPYLGASGHLVILRHKTYDYLHVHPEGDTFHTSVTEPGWYELFLQFKHGGKVHTAQFTMKASGEPAATEMDHDHDH